MGKNAEPQSFNSYLVTDVTPSQGNDQKEISSLLHLPLLEHQYSWSKMKLISHNYLI